MAIAKKIQLSQAKSDLEKDGQEELQSAISNIWLRFKPVSLQRVALVESAITALLSGPIDPELQKKAEGEAHKLAGSLGSFGFADGSRDAREIEIILQSEHLIEPQILRLSELVVNLHAQLEMEQTDRLDSFANEKKMVESEQVAANEEASSGVESKSVDVVVVDDDEVLSSLLLHSLKTQGYQTEWIVDGQVAADKLRGPTPTVKARIVVLDVNLPSLDGISVLRELSRTGALKETKVIMLTVRSSEPEVLSTLHLGAFDHVAKPVSVPILLQRVKRALGS